jgi:hypothetical protein
MPINYPVLNFEVIVKYLLFILSAGCLFAAPVKLTQLQVPVS